MKHLLFTLIFGFAFYGFSQNDTLTCDDLILYSKKQCDSLFKIRKSLDDGKYMVYYDADRKYISKIFHLQDGNVTDLFRSYSCDGYLTTGYYKDDSLWTFRELDKKSSFKRGRWSYKLGYQIHFPNDIYEMDYDRDSIFVEVWRYQNDNVMIIRKYHQRIGLFYEAGYYNNGVIQTEIEIYPNATLTKNFDTIGNIESLYLLEDVGFEIVLNKSSSYYPTEAVKYVSIRKDFSEKNVSNELNTDIYLDKNNNITQFRRKGFSVIFDRDSKTVFYKKRNKYKKLKIKTIKKIDKE